MNRKEILDSYLAKHDVGELIAKKINPNSFLTDNFAYGAMRIGNSIGDILDISIEIILLDEIAKNFNLIMNTTEHAELHSRGVTEKDLNDLVKGAVLFENIKHNKKQYKNSLKEITEFIRNQMGTIIKES